MKQIEQDAGLAKIITEMEKPLSAQESGCPLSNVCELISDHTSSKINSITLTVDPGNPTNYEFPVTEPIDETVKQIRETLFAKHPRGTVNEVTVKFKS